MEPTYEEERQVVLQWLRRMEGWHLTQVRALEKLGRSDGSAKLKHHSAEGRMFQRAASLVERSSKREEPPI